MFPASQPSTSRPAAPAHVRHQVESWRGRIEEALAACMAFEGAVPGALHESLRHAVLAGGKRYRGLLAFGLAADLSLPETDVLSSALALELIHSASLVIDDLPCMDNAARRRSAPSTHAAFGEPTALLCGITLLARAHEVVARDAALKPAARAGMGEVLAVAVGAMGLCGGQFDDLFQTGSSSEAALIDRYRRKTGALFAAALQCPGLAAGLAPHLLARLKRAGEGLGLAFQLYDDLIDHLGTAEAAGKDVRQDHGKVTLATVLGPDVARTRADAELAMVQSEIKALCGDGYAAGLVSMMSARAAGLLA